MLPSTAGLMISPSFPVLVALDVPGFHPDRARERHGPRLWSDLTRLAVEFCSETPMREGQCPGTWWRCLLRLASP